MDYSSVDKMGKYLRTNILKVIQKEIRNLN